MAARLRPPGLPGPADAVPDAGRALPPPRRGRRALGPGRGQPGGRRASARSGPPGWPWRPGRPERAGLAFALNPLVAISLVMDFADALALAGLVGVASPCTGALGLGGGRRRRPRCWPRTSRGAALAALVLLWPVAGAVRRRWSIVVVPASAALGWARVRPLAPGLAGQRHRGAHARSRSGATSTPTGGAGASTATGATRVFALFLLVAAAVVVVRWWRRRNVEMTLALPFAVLVPFLTATVMDLAINSFRVHRPGPDLRGHRLVRRDQAGRRSGGQSTPPTRRPGRPGWAA